MAAYWGCTAYRVDLLTAQPYQIEAAVNACYPRLPRDEKYAILQDVIAAAALLRVQQSAIAAGHSASNAAIMAIKDQSTRVGTAAVSAAGAAITDVGRRVGNSASEIIGRVGAASDDLISRVTSGIGAAIGGASDTIGDLIGAASSGVGRLLGSAGNTVGQIALTVRNGAASLISSASAAVGSAVSQASAALRSLVGRIEAAIGPIIAGVADGLAGLVNTAGSLLGTTVRSVRAFIGDLIANVETGIAGIVERLSSIPGALADFGADVIGAVGGSVGGIVEGIVAGLGDPLGGIIGGFFHGEEDRLLGLVNDAYDRILANDAVPADVKRAVRDAKTPGAPVPAIVAAVVAPFIIVTMLGTIMGPFAAKIVQEEASFVRPTLLGLGDLVAAQHRGLRPAGYYATIGAKSGYTDDDLALALEVSRPLPTVADVLDWQHREVLTESETRSELARQGFDPTTIGRLIEGAEVLPGVSDAVRFAVREAYPGQAAYDGPRGSSVPGGFADAGARLGLSDSSIRSYWAAHWDLPSLTAGFAMYHRGLINEAELRGLLREADVAPEWVDPLIAIAFDPLTRVDVRRMYGLGVLSAAEVARAYRDLGYSAENAARLAEFTVAEDAAGRAERPDPERDLTRADLIGAYADGLITSSAVLGELGKLGYSDDEAELLIAREDVRRITAERKAIRTTAIERATAGAVTTSEALDELRSAGFTTSEVESAEREIERRIAATVKQPTKADLDRFRKARLMSDEGYADELRALGYPDRWVELFVRLPAGATRDA